jgi:uncharacterized protein YbjT (DUF2867 family)
MTSLHKTILVLGATGQQGGATARHLLEKGWSVRALARDPHTLAAQLLHQAGAEIVQGDLADRASLETAMQGVYGVFCVLPFSPLDEAHQGENVADIARVTGVQHFIYSSVKNAEGLFHIGVNVNKWKNERYIQALRLPVTILRPTAFMDDLVGPFFGVPSGTYSTALKPDVTVQLIAVDDISALAALAFEQPHAYIGKTIELIADVLTSLQVAATLSHVLGRSIPYVQLPIETIRQQNADLAHIYELVNNGSYTRDHLHVQADIATVRKLYPDLMNLETWLEKQGKAKFAALLNTQSR